MSQFRLRPNTSDAIFQKYIWQDNEYRIPEQLNENTSIIDVGCHIGLFSYLCWQRGARNIMAFEPFSENYNLAKFNLESTSISLSPKAVWRSDGLSDEQLFLTSFSLMHPDGPDPVNKDTLNTGTPSVFGESGDSVETVSLDSLIGDKVIDILKLDCEGSEFPILLTSKKLKQVRYITGEYHLMDNVPQVGKVNGINNYSVGTLADLLTALRFKIEIVPFKDPLFSDTTGNFFAYNLDL
ncbi:FkbM family methyltransferase [Crocosphaera sp. Alani8]|uniref:FkbM family methyltransferase n=1 Tax=Crocosphaera sp. Alani8 TaxID=3038952 RepID=UPI00313C3487